MTPPAKPRESGTGRAHTLRMVVEWRWVYAAVVVVVATVWLNSIHTFLSPVIAYVMLLALLRPFAGNRRYRTLVITSTVLMALWLFSSLGSILAPFIVAFVIAYILHPLVDRLVRRGMPRGAAVAVVIVPILAILVLSLVFGIPALVGQIETLIKALPETVQRVATTLENLRARVMAANLPFGAGDSVARLNVDQAKIAAFLEAQQKVIAARAWHTVLGVGKGVTFLLTMIGYLVLTPVLIIYLLKDYNSMSARLRELIPMQQRASWIAFLAKFDDLLSRFLRGQLIEAVLVGIITWLGLMLFGVPYAGLVGVVAGVFNLIPYLGLVVSVIPVIIIAVMSGNFISIIAKSGIVFFVVQLIDSTITGPRIVGGSIGIHPVVVILSLAVGSFFFGFVGLLLAMPAAILMKLLLRDAIARYKASALYRGNLPAETT
jgi:predicted PurR-regulated permease PerM